MHEKGYIPDASVLRWICLVGGRVKLILDVTSETEEVAGI